MNNYSYKYGQTQYMNRAERRKNKIEVERQPKCNYTTEELGAILKKELNNLINISCSEAIKREKYRKLEPLIREYQRQLAEKKAVTPTKRTILSTQAYNRQKEELKYNSTYQKLMSNSYQARKASNVTPQKAISAYEKFPVGTLNTINQSKVASNNVTTKAQKLSQVTEKQKQVVQTQKQVIQKQKNIPQTKVKPIKKKSIFSAILEFFKPQKPVATTAKKEKPKISKPKISEKPKTYLPPINIITDAVYNEFEKQLRNFENYSKEVNGFKYYKGGRKVIDSNDFVIG